MKGKRAHKGTGGVNEEKEDVDTKPEMRVNAKKIDAEAEEKKHGGRAKKKGGGRAMHHEAMSVHGKHFTHHLGRKPRKSGGRA